MMRVAVLIAAVVCVAALPHDRVSSETKDFTVQFNEFEQLFDKKYADAAERRYRFAVFTQNMQRAEEMNKEEGETVYGPTKFSDLTPLEFKTRFLTFKRSTDRSNAVVAARSEVGFNSSSSADWVKKGAVSAVKDQGQCGSCWAFSCVEQIESDAFLATGSLPVLAPQQVVSCDTVDAGCDGGDTISCYEYVEQAGGLEKESSYPYKSGDTGRDGTCKAKKSKEVVDIKGYKYVSVTGKLDEDAMQTYVSSKGPLSICVDAESWQMYSGGVLKGRCGTDLDHCVQITGFDADASTPYWTIRNSWNTDWGEEGFIRVKMGDNKCGVAEEATFSTGASNI